MSGVVVLILRLLLALALYAFLGLTIFVIWKEFRAQTKIKTPEKIPGLILIAKNDTIETLYELSLAQIIIGREPGCDLSINNETVSAHHARINFNQNKWWLEDLQSTNGTFVNDERISTPVVILNGDEVRCGQVTILVEFPGNDDSSKA